MTTINVSNANQLYSALQAAHGGDTISLASGNYGDVAIKSLKFASDVTITSTTASAPATFHTLNITGSSHIHLDDVNVNFTPSASTYSFSNAVSINSSSAITLSHGAITGGNAINGVAQTSVTLDATGNVLGLPTGIGVNIQKSTGVTVDHMNISHLDRGVVMGASDTVTVSHNEIHDLRRTDISGSGVNNVTVDNNTLHDSNPWKWGDTQNSGDHADFIAFWTDPNTQTSSSTNIQVTNNLMEQGKGTAILGVWFEGQYGNLGFKNVTIEGNTILNGNAQGVMLKSVDGATVDHNTLLQSSGDAKSAPGILMNAGVQHVTITSNITGSVNDLSGAGTNTVTANQLVQETSATAAGYYTADLLKHLVGVTNYAGIYNTITADLSAIKSAAQIAGTPQAAAVASVISGGAGNDVLLGSTGSDTINGGAGADTIIGGRGGDVLTGGYGNDTFRFSTYGGKDVVTDFGAHGDHDILDLSAFKAANLKPVLHDVGDDVQISFATGDVITLTGVHAKSLIATSGGFTI